MWLGMLLVQPRLPFKQPERAKIRQVKHPSHPGVL